MNTTAKSSDQISKGQQHYKKITFSCKGKQIPISFFGARELKIKRISPSEYVERSQNY